jgi:hypothetical protein
VDVQSHLQRRLQRLRATSSLRAGVQTPGSSSLAACLILCMLLVDTAEYHLPHLFQSLRSSCVSGLLTLDDANWHGHTPGRLVKHRSLDLTAGYRLGVVDWAR